MIGTITLNPCIDVTLRVKKLVKDDANRASAALYSAGGKGFNVSKVITELGGRTTAYAMIAGSTGHYWQKLAKEAKVKTHCHVIDGVTRVNSAITDMSDDSETRISAPGPFIEDQCVQEMLKILSVSRQKAWVLSGSPGRGASADVYAKMVRALNKTGALSVVDADGVYLKKAISEKPFMIKPNEYELERLLGKRLTLQKNILSAGRKLVDQGVRVVVVSMGAKGAMVIHSSGAFVARGISVPVKSKVGAGDSFVGGFLYAYLRKKSMEDCARFGVAAATSTVYRQGPRLCLREDISAFLSKVRIEAI